MEAEAAFNSFKRLNLLRRFPWEDVVDDEEEKAR